MSSLADANLPSEDEDDEDYKPQTGCKKEADTPGERSTK